jgi:hypothetical protein
MTPLRWDVGEHWLCTVLKEGLIETVHQRLCTQGHPRKPAVLHRLIGDAIEPWHPALKGGAQDPRQAALGDQTVPLRASTSLGLLLPHHCVHRAQKELLSSAIHLARGKEPTRLPAIKVPVLLSARAGGPEADAQRAKCATSMLPLLPRATQLLVKHQDTVRRPEANNDSNLQRYATGA